MTTLTVIGLLVLIIVVMLYSHFHAKSIEKIPPTTDGQLGSTAAFILRSEDSKFVLADSKAKEILTFRDFRE